MKWFSILIQACLWFCPGALWAQATNVFPSSGNVGIGTTAPTTTLQVAGTVTSQSIVPAGNVLYSLGSPSSTYSDVYAKTLHLAGGNSLAQLSNVYGGNSYVDDILSIGANWTRTGETTGTPWTTALGAAEIVMEAGNVANNGNYSSLSFATGGSRGGTPTSRMFITDAGNVGIGTTSPLNLLQLHAGTNLNLGVRYDGQANAIGLGTYNDAGTTAIPLSFNASSFAFINGNVGIGTTNPAHLLHVAGTIGAEQVIVSATGADYVFDSGYRLTPLAEVSAYISRHHHLPDMPSASEVHQDGFKVGEMESKLLAKVEEITLHLIQAEERSQKLAQDVSDLREENRRLQVRIGQMEGQNDSSRVFRGDR